VFVCSWLSVKSGNGQPIDSLLSLYSDQSITGREHINVTNLLATRLRTSKLDQAEGYANEALNDAKKLEYVEGMADAYVTLGLLAWVKTMPVEALEFGKKALQLSDSVQFMSGIINSHLLLGSCYRDVADIENLHKHAEIALALSLKTNHVEGIARAYNLFGNYSRATNLETKAIHFYEQGISVLGNHREPELLTIRTVLVNNLLRNYLKDPGLYEQKIKTYLPELERLSKANSDSFGLLSYFMRLAEFAMYKSQYDEVIDNYRKAEEICKEEHSPIPLKEIYGSLAILFAIRGNIIQAKIYQQRLAEVQDSLFSLERAKQLGSFEAQLQTTLKDKEIRLLNDQKLYARIGIAILILLLTIILVFAVIVVRTQRAKASEVSKNLETQKILNDTLLKTERFRSDLLAQISHELRTPLSLVLGPIENELTKNRTTLSSSTIENLSLARKNGQRLLELVNQLLEHYKLQSGKMEARLVAGKLEIFLESLTQSFRTIAGARNITFQSRINVQQGYFYFDSDKLYKIANNLLSNAFKFTPSGGVVELKAEIHDDLLVIFVRDTGPGISEQEKKLIFEPFYQVKKEHSFLGYGLGLSLVKDLTKILGGRLDLESKPGEGSSFYVYLPIKASLSGSDDAHSGTEIELDASQDPLTVDLSVHPEIEPIVNILVVEDNEDMRTFMSRVMAGEGYKVQTAINGKEALVLAQKDIPDIIISDLMMPEMDGMEFTKAIKEDERTSHIPIILLTARADQVSKLEGLRSGANEYLTKPFSSEELVIRINNLVEERKRLVKTFQDKQEQNLPKYASIDDKFINKLTAIVEANLADYTFSVEKLAEESSLSRTQLLRKLKAITGYTPNDFIRDYRLNKAAQMIMHRADSISQIAYAVGFNDQSYFTKCFKKKYQVTPSEFESKYVLS